METIAALRVAVTAAGAALAGLGALRLGRVGLPRMPGRVAWAAVALGGAVAGFGLWLRPSPPPPAPAATLLPEPQAPVRVTGTVRRPDGEPVAGARVVLRRFERTEEVEARTATTGPDGSFAFEGLPASPTTAYSVATELEGTEFRSDLLFPGPQGETQRADLVVAPVTQDPSALRVEVDSTVVVGDRGGAEVLHILRLRNAGDRAFVGGLRLPLLPKAAGLDPRRGLDRTRLGLEQGELVSRAPVLPGTGEIVYSYTVPVPRSGLRLDRSLRYPTDRFALLVGGDLRAAAAGLRRGGPVRLQGRTYTSFRAASLAPGTRVRADLRAAEPGAGLRAALLGAGGAVAAAALAYPLVRRRRPAPRPDPSPTPVR